MAVSSYAKGTPFRTGEGPEGPRQQSRRPPRLVVEDIFDTGLTLHYLQDLLKARAPRSMKTACLSASRRAGRSGSRSTTSASTSRITSSSATASTTRRVPQPSLHRDTRAVAVASTSSETGNWKLETGNWKLETETGTATDMVLRFDIITEAEPQIEHGATVELSKGGTSPAGAGHAPRAPDHSGARPDRSMPRCGDLAPTSDIRRVAIASDHTGVKMRGAIGSICADEESPSISWRGRPGVRGLPGHAARVARQVARGEADGIVIDGAGIGVGDSGEQSPRRPRRDDHRRDHRPYASRAQGTNVMTLGSTLLPDTRMANPPGRPLAGHA